MYRLARCKEAIQKIGRSALRSSLSLCYPHECFHCGEESLDENHPLCEQCLIQLEQLPLQQSCQRCGTPSAGITALCQRCRKALAPIDELVSLFDYSGPAATLIKALKMEGCCWLAAGMAGWLALQLLALPHLQPDLILSVPLSAQRLLLRGYNQSELLAQELATLLSLPYSPLLGRYSGAYSQMQLSKEQREALPSGYFTLREECPAGLKLLIIDDVLTTGTTLRHCGRALEPLQPKALYAATFCAVSSSQR